MYPFSRALFKELAPIIATEPVNPSAGSNRELVLRACELTLERLADDYRYFPDPERFLFEQIRMYFPITEQLLVYNTVKKHLSLATEVVKAYAAKGYKPDGTRVQCRATTRRSTACIRNVVLGSEYCPSHQHLAEPHFTQAPHAA